MISFKTVILNQFALDLNLEGLENIFLFNDQSQAVWDYKQFFSIRWAAVQRNVENHCFKVFNLITKEESSIHVKISQINTLNKLLKVQFSSLIISVEKNCVRDTIALKPALSNQNAPCRHIRHFCGDKVFAVATI